LNSIVIITSFIVFKQFEPALYGIISLVISSNAISRLRHKGIDVAKHLISDSPRGVTIIDAVGGYTMTNKNVLVCALKENEAVKQSISTLLTAFCNLHELLTSQIEISIILYRTSANHSNTLCQTFSVSLN
jgi:hypothetical protein